VAQKKGKKNFIIPEILSTIDKPDNHDNTIYFIEQINISWNW